VRVTGVPAGSSIIGRLGVGGSVFAGVAGAAGAAGAADADADAEGAAGAAAGPSAHTDCVASSTLSAAATAPRLT
jgi:hypothetical protein